MAGPGPTAAFPDAENITFSCILGNGNILFATREELFLIHKPADAVRFVEEEANQSPPYSLRP